MRSITLGLLAVVCLVQSPAEGEDKTQVKTARTPWPRHTVDDRFQGADGVRLGDFDGDGHLDVVTGWEESGVVRFYLNPGPDLAKQPWPAVTVAAAASPEDAVPVDVDGDGNLDIVSCHEGKRRQVLVHFSNVNDPANPDDWLSQDSWTTESFPSLDGVMWMYALPFEDIDGRRAIIVGGKSKQASLSLLLSPTKKNSRDLGRWEVIRIRDVAWTMSLHAIDMDHDGDQDLVFTDRKGSKSMAGWLEQPEDPRQTWREHPIAGQGREVMFLSATRDRWLIPTRRTDSLDCRREGNRWIVSTIKHPPQIEFGKAIGVLPSGRLLLSSNTKASRYPDRPGLWLRDLDGQWSVVDPTRGVKFDRFEMIDLDADGDLDAMTCEERQNFGVVWYENPGL
ncbi:FG-GAP repeat domain-containing protein [Roseiconus lacunae]|uniref:FG-GAP repeat domain-containing protein n=1 Tax=Roseiconus lacunae TaxID=2605694 RepID=UPI001E5518BF|nr:VCBS repeat-containing protein [Roseiconus lacunae]MCD0458504.1 VCBS repeat-containing protein [Roseiconus lacunae]